MRSAPGQPERTTDEGESSRVGRGDRRHGARHHGFGHGAAGLGGVADRGDRLRHQPHATCGCTSTCRTASRPDRPILVAVHYCTGSGPAFYSGTEFASLADRYGFIVDLPVGDPQRQLLRRLLAAGADATTAAATRSGIVSMVDYVRAALQRRPRAGSTSPAPRPAAMMTNVLLGDYPDVFKAGAAFMGVPFGCFATDRRLEWNSDCANGQIIQDPAAVGRPGARDAYPGYTGAAAADAAVARHRRRPRCATRTSARRSSSGPTCSG